MGGKCRLAAIVAVAGLGLAACSGSTQPSPPREAAEPRPTHSWLQTKQTTAPTAPIARPTPRPKRTGLVAHAASRPRLIAFDSCDDLLTRMKREALSQVGPYGLPDGAMAHGDAVATAGRAEGAPAAAAGDGAGTTYSTTNNQEAGVDEADQVKTDGRLLLAVRHQPLGVQVVDVSGGHARLRGFHRLADSMYGAQLLMVGGRAVVVGAAASREQEQYRPRTEVQVLSLSDPNAPKVERRFELEGSMSAAREIGGRVLLVVQSSPEVVWAQPADGSRAESDKALRENRRRISVSTVDAWLPSVTSTRSGRTYRSSCSSSMRAQSASGTAMTSVVSLDPASDVPGKQVSVAGSGSIVYASPLSVYVTTWPWEAQVATSSRVPDEQDVTTSVHGFDVRDAAAPRYTGSGSVRGSLVGQYAMSEHEGHLRVASTVGRTWAQQGEQQPPSDNLVTVLRPGDDGLVQVGRVSGLGRGERIYGVRFLGDLGYVVTFRQTDPLYVLDLSDPQHPTKQGELHVTGYSSYLHPVGPGMLLGIGQAVDENRRQGTHVSTFDVTLPQAPRLRARQVFPGGSSAAEHDPHAVLWWPATRLAVIPLSQYQPETTKQASAFDGVVALRLGADGALREVGRISHPNDTQAPGDSRMCCWGGILRSVVVGDALLTLSENGIMASELDTLEEQSWSPYR